MKDDIYVLARRLDVSKKTVLNCIKETANIHNIPPKDAAILILQHFGTRVLTHRKFKDRVEYRYHGQLHNFGDLPAIVFNDGERYYYKYDKLHRDDDKPAMVRKLGNFYYKNGKLHRDDDKPAVEYHNGSKLWYRNGKLYKELYVNTALAETIVKKTDGRAK